MSVKDVLHTRREQVRTAKAQAVAAIAELERQINALIGREEELTELIALLDKGQPDGD